MLAFFFIALSLVIYIRVGLDIRFGRIFGRIPDIELIRPNIQYSRIFSHTLLKLSGRLTDNLVFSIKQNLYYLVGYPAEPDIQPNPNLYQSWKVQGSKKALLIKLNKFVCFIVGYITPYNSLIKSLLSYIYIYLFSYISFFE